MVRLRARGCQGEGPGAGVFGVVCGCLRSVGGALGDERRPQRGHEPHLGTGTLASTRRSRSTLGFTRLWNESCSRINLLCPRLRLRQTLLEKA